MRILISIKICMQHSLDFNADITALDESSLRTYKKQKMYGANIISGVILRKTEGEPVFRI